MIKLCINTDSPEVANDIIQNQRKRTGRLAVAVAFVLGCLLTAAYGDKVKGVAHNLRKKSEGAVDI